LFDLFAFVTLHFVIAFCVCCRTRFIAALHDRYDALALSASVMFIRQAM